MEVLVRKAGTQHAQIVYRAAEERTEPGAYNMGGRLWKHPNGVWYVLYGRRLKQRISTRSKERGTAEEFQLRFFRSQP